MYNFWKSSFSILCMFNDSVQNSNVLFEMEVRKSIDNSNCFRAQIDKEVVKLSSSLHTRHSATAASTKATLRSFKTYAPGAHLSASPPDINHLVDAVAAFVRHSNGLPIR